MNITLPYVDRLINQKQSEINRDKWGSSNWFFIIFNNIEEIQFTEEYILLSTIGNIGIIEVDSHQISVETKIFLKIYKDSQATQNIVNQKEGTVSFDIFLKEILVSNERDSISEIHISPKSTFFNLSSYIFILMSMWIKWYLLCYSVMYFIDYK